MKSLRKKEGKILDLNSGNIDFTLKVKRKFKF